MEVSFERIQLVEKNQVKKSKSFRYNKEGLFIEIYLAASFKD